MRAGADQADWRRGQAAVVKLTPHFPYLIIALKEGARAGAQTNIPTEKEKTQKSPRVPRADEHAGRESGNQSPKAKGQIPPGGGLTISTFPAKVLAGSKGIKREQRLRKKSDFQGVYSSGRSHSNRLLALRSLPNALGITRFGFVASKRLGKAVARNRIRRRLRESVRVMEIKEGMDLVFIARNPAKDADFRQLQSAAADLLRRARLLVEIER